MPAVLIPIAISLAISAVLTVAQMLLTPKPKPPKQSDANRSSTQTIRQPLGYRRRIYGEVRVGGHPVYMGTPVHKGNFQLCAVFAAHEVDAIRTIFVGDHAVYDTDLGVDGYATGPRYFKTWQTGSASYLALFKRLGTADQTAFESLIARSNGEWTTEHRLRGCAAIHAEFDWEENIYAGGLPNLSAVIRGAKVYDPRDAGTRWTPNFALCLRDYLLTAIEDGGCGADPDEIDDAEWIAAANICDEIVATPTTGDAAVMHTVVEASPALDTIELDDLSLKFQWGDRVEVASTGTLPTGLSAATPYYAIPYRDRNSLDTAGSRVAIKLATTYANALAAVPIDITSAGDGTITVTKTGEPRWTMNGAFETDQAPRKIIEEMIASCGMHIPYSAGMFRPMGLAWEAPTLTLDEDDLRGPLKVSTRRPRRDRFNALKGTYTSPLNDWQPSDWPPITSEAYEAEDGQRIFNELDQPYTSRSGQAQRAAKTELVRNRFERVVNYPAMLTAYDCKAGDMIAVDNERWEWAGKTFEVVDRKPTLIAEEGEVPYFGIDLVLNESSEDAFDWVAAEEGADPPVIVPTLPDWTDIEPPGAPEVSEFLYEGRLGSDIKAVVTVAWAASISGFVRRYEIEFKFSALSSWLAGPSIPVDDTGETTLSVDLPDFEPGVYDFRVRARTSVGAVSEWSTTTDKVIFGLSAPPVAMTGLGLQKLGGTAVVTWDLHADADVVRGGWIEFRHNPSEGATDPSDSTSIGSNDGRVVGRSTIALLPLKTGTYFVRAIDKLENKGPWSYISTDGATILEYSTLGSIVEDPVFAGTHDNTQVSGVTLTLGGGLDIDDWGDVDDVLDWDGEGGAAAAGSYGFSAYLDSGTTTAKRLRGHILATVVNTGDTIDQRTENIDTWESFDGATAPGAADAWIEFRETDDNPAGAPVWSDWQRLDVTEVTKRYFELRSELRSYDPAYNINVTELRAYLETI